ncbi:MAG: alpha/beta hydrolase [Betaproteobacteria bacterium]|nr:alpha/beta hydrolase [Betaproteobacteria bacterium]
MELLVRNRKSYFYTGGKAFDSSLPSVVFIHGAEQDHCIWVLQSRYLAHHGSSVLAIDLPGHGRSEGPPLASVEAIADWIVALLDAAGVKQAALVGHSMGSLAALDCAARYPERASRVALLGNAYPMKVSPELLAATRDDEPLAQNMVNLWSHSAYAHYPSNPGPGFWVRGEDLRLMQRQKPGVMHVDFAACNAYSAGLERAAQLKCPALFVLGKRDVMTPARSGRDLAKAVAGARVVEIAGAGHALMAEKPDEVLDALVPFLRESGIKMQG